jgi:hypothetical protein
MGIMAAAAFGLAACGGGEENSMAIENVEDFNATEDMNMGMDMNTDMNMDMNTTGNVTDNAMGNTMDNSATTNSY